MSKGQASDLYLTVGAPPMLRIDDELQKIKEEILTLEDINDMISDILTQRQLREYEMAMELNTSLDLGKFGRFRINILKQRQSPALVIRRIISNIPDFAKLRLPLILEKLSMEERGLVLLTGSTGSGKSTTLAAMLDYRNRNKEGHIITIEDPIEFFHEHKKSVVTQREVGVDTESYSVAMKNVLRQRPDVICVGEIRDRDVMQQALLTAETGHLCLSTLHTSNAHQSIERMVNLFPEMDANQIRLSLAMNLKAIISQRLVHGINGGLIMAVEIMLNQGLVKELIRKGDITKIKEVMAQNNTTGMCTFDQCLLRLYAEGVITEETALSQADQPGNLQILIQQIKLGGDDGDALRIMDTSILQIKDGQDG
jgi:twitching motility protein PilU